MSDKKYHGLIKLNELTAILEPYFEDIRKCVGDSGLIIAKNFGLKEDNFKNDKLQFKILSSYMTTHKDIKDISIPFNAKITVVVYFKDNPNEKDKINRLSPGWWVASGMLEMLPGCCGIAVSHHSRVEKGFRGLGIGSIMSNIRKVIATNLDYSVLLCTDIRGNIPQQKILGNLGYKEVDSFINKHTGNAIAIHTVKL